MYRIVGAYRDTYRIVPYLYRYTPTKHGVASDESFPDWSWIPDFGLKDDILKAAGFG